MPPISYSHALLVTGSRTWNDEIAMRRAFNEVWIAWAADAPIVRPVLVSGHCPDGADAMAERLWRSAGLDVVEMPADWSRHGKRAGFLRNERMVDRLLRLAETGTEVRAAAFLDLCRKDACPQRGRQQLLPERPGHFSHGTVHCRSEAIAAGVRVVDAQLKTG